jgi:hypothetical protein
VLSNTAHARLLPPSWMTLYELTKLPEETLRKKIDCGAITPKIERKDVVLMRPTSCNQPVKAKSATLGGVAGPAASKKRIPALPKPSTPVVVEVVAPDERVALLEEFARFVLARTEGMRVDPKDHDEWKTLKGKVQAMLPEGGAP